MVREPFEVHLFEEHSSTLPLWWEHDDLPGTVVYLDAHLDLQQIEPRKLDALRRCRTPGEVRALEAPHHLNASARYAFGIEDFLYPAARLGLVDRLIWVAPPHIPRRYSPGLLEFVQQMDGVTFEELTSFAPVGGRALRGNLLDLDITICDYDDLGSLGIGADYKLDIDVDYFVVVPGDRLWIDPATVINGITRQLGPPATATVSRAVSSGFTPLNLRFLGDYVCALLKRDRDDVEHYRQLVDAVRHIDGHELLRARELLEHAIQSRPACAAAHYLLARTETDSDVATGMRAHCAALDPGFTPDPCARACGYPNRRMPLAASALKNLAVELENLAADHPHRDATEVALAQLYARAGRLQQSHRLFSQLRNEYAQHAETALELARAMLSNGHQHEAMELLEVARASFKTRTTATQTLADVLHRAGETRRALDLYRDVSGGAPAWLLPLRQQLLCHQRLGDPVAADVLANVVNERESVLAQLCRNTEGA